MTPTTRKLDKRTKYNIWNELKKNMDRNSKLALSNRKVEVNLAKLRAHLAATQGDDGGQSMVDIVAQLHPTVQGVYHLLQGQTTTIVAAINGRADAIDDKLNQQNAKLDQQMRIMRGQLLPED